MFDCTRPIKKRTCDDTKGERRFFDLDPLKKNILRIVNHGYALSGFYSSINHLFNHLGYSSSLADIEITVDNHVLIPLEADGTPLSPQPLRSVIISPGQRYAVLLDPLHKPPKEGDAFYLRAVMSPECFNIPSMIVAIFFLHHSLNNVLFLVHKQILNSSWNKPRSSSTDPDQNGSSLKPLTPPHI